MEKNWFTVKQVLPNVWGIAEFEHDEKVISYLFVGEKKALLFDSGMGIGNIKDEVEKLTQLPILVVNSHCHFDHIGGNNQFKKVALFDSLFSKSIAKYGSTLVYGEKTLITKPFSYTEILRDGEVINIDPFIFYVMATPGHTPDSICLFEKTNKILLAGDTLYPGPIFLQFPESNRKKYVHSIKKIIALSDEVSYVFPGHNEFFLDKNVLRAIGKNLTSIAYTSEHKFSLNTNNLSFIFK